MVYISFLISHVPPAHSFFQKKSILINLTHVFQGGRTNYVTVPIPYFFRAPV